MAVVGRALLFLVGLFAVAGTIGSAVRTVILPRAVASFITRRVFRTMRVFFNIRVGPRASYETVDRVLAAYGPVSLVALLITWLTILLGGYVADVQSSLSST